MLRILNIVADEKFIDGVIECQDLTSSVAKHEYVIIGDSLSDYKFIKNSNRVQHLSPRDFLAYLNINKIDAVFLHSLCVLPSYLLSKIPKNIKVFWYSWGYDIYSYPIGKPFVPLKLYGERTDSIRNPISISFKDRVKLLIKKVTLWDYFKIKSIYDSLKRIDYYSGVLEYEYDLVKPIPNFTAKRVSYQYNNLSVLNNVVDENLSCGGNILLGNSASDCNNHTDLVDYLSKIRLENRKIYMPLSYAGVSDYISKVKSCFTSKFGSTFCPLDSFIPYDEYSKIMNSCSIAIFAHERQQAIGNINMALINGCKVFLSETNMVYSFYKSLGIIIYSYQKDLNQNEIDSPMTIDQVMTNRRILNQRYCRDTYLQNLNEIYNLLK